MKILVVAPHCDDEVLGCGGTIAKYAASGNDVYVLVVTKAVEPLFSKDLAEQVRNEGRAADKLLGVKETIFFDFPAAMMEDVPRYKINDAFTKIIQQIKPDIVFMPHRGDMQLDHKLTVDSLMVALRPKYDHIVKHIYAYETLSETGWDIQNHTNAFIPNVFIDISDYLNLKLEAMKLFESQLAEFPQARSIEAIRALAEYRGATMTMRAAEAFVAIREVLE